MTYCINTECVYTHLDVIRISLYKIIVNKRIFCIKVYTVICNLSYLTGIIIPVECSVMMINIILRCFF